MQIQTRLGLETIGPNISVISGIFRIFQNKKNKIDFDFNVSFKLFNLPLNNDIMSNLTEKEISLLFYDDLRLINALEGTCKTKYQQNMWESLTEISKDLFETQMEVYIRGEGFPETRTCYELMKRIAEVYSTLKSFEFQSAFQLEIGEKLPQYTFEQIHYALQRLLFAGIAGRDKRSYTIDSEKSYGFCYVYVEPGFGDRKKILDDIEERTFKTRKRVYKRIFGDNIPPELLDKDTWGFPILAKLFIKSSKNKNKT